MYSSRRGRDVSPRADGPFAHCRSPAQTQQWKTQLLVFIVAAWHAYWRKWLVKHYLFGGAAGGRGRRAALSLAGRLWHPGGFKVWKRLLFEASDLRKRYPTSPPDLPEKRLLGAHPCRRRTTSLCLLHNGRACGTCGGGWCERAKWRESRNV